MPVIDADGCPIYVGIEGPAGAPVLMLSNSLGTTHAMWQPQVDAFTQHFRLVRLDRRGHGQSGVPPGPYTMERLGRDALAVLDALGLERAHVVGHSMGGLVARHFLECREGWRDTRRLVTIGTPYGGALGSLGTLVNGKKIKFFDLTKASRSMTALYQLLPVYPCYDAGDGKLQRVVDAAIPNLDAAKAQAALDFHLEIATEVEKHLKDQEYLDNRYTIRPIVGIEQPTQQSALLKGDKVELLKSRGGEDLGGDGTVPRPSATPSEFENLENAIYGAQRHASLQNDDDVLFQLNGVLSDDAFDPREFAATKAAEGKIEQALDIVDLAAPGEPIVVRAKPKDDPQGLLIATVENVEGGMEPLRVGLTAVDDGWFEGTIASLDEGVYRVTSGNAQVEDVSDLVTVVAE